jgi:NADH:ubiquinone oxidoreductase subunit H
MGQPFPLTFIFFRGVETTNQLVWNDYSTDLFLGGWVETSVPNQWQQKLRVLVPERNEN